MFRSRKLLLCFYLNGEKKKEENVFQTFFAKLFFFWRQKNNFIHRVLAPLIIEKAFFLSPFPRMSDFAKNQHYYPPSNG